MNLSEKSKAVERTCKQVRLSIFSNKHISNNYNSFNLEKALPIVQQYSLENNVDTYHVLRVLGVEVGKLISAKQVSK